MYFFLKYYEHNPKSPSILANNNQMSSVSTTLHTYIGIKTFDYISIFMVNHLKRVALTKDFLCFNQSYYLRTHYPIWVKVDMVHD